MAFKMKGSPFQRNFGIGGSGMGQKSAEDARISSLTESQPLPEGTGKKYTKTVKPKSNTKEVKSVQKTAKQKAIDALIDEQRAFSNKGTEAGDREASKIYKQIKALRKGMKKTQKASLGSEMMEETISGAMPKKKPKKDKRRTKTFTTDGSGNVRKTVTRTSKKGDVKSKKVVDYDASGTRTKKTHSSPNLGGTRTVEGKGLGAKVTDRTGRTGTRRENIKRDVKKTLKEGTHVAAMLAGTSLGMVGAAKGAGTAVAAIPRALAGGLVGAGVGNDLSTRALDTNYPHMDKEPNLTKQVLQGYGNLAKSTVKGVKKGVKSIQQKVKNAPATIKQKIQSKRLEKAKSATKKKYKK